ncbi:MAG: hypothetical protein PHT69_02450 [Bacteroidales bacterium]|nr:hypothetical protein [Bacteroidales bacterium]
MENKKITHDQKISIIKALNNDKIKKVYVKSYNGEPSQIRMEYYGGSDYCLIDDVNPEEAEIVLKKIKQIKEDILMEKYKALFDD